MKNFTTKRELFCNGLGGDGSRRIKHLMSGLGDFNIPSDSDRVRVLLVHRATLFQVRFLGNPNLRE